MKRMIVTCLAILVMVVGVQAQQATKDMATMASLVGQSSTEFVQGMKGIGFDVRKDETADGVRELGFRGSYDRFRKSHAWATMITAGSDVVSNIGVVLPEREDWKTLEEDYRYVQENLKKAFGTEVDKTEEFDKGSGLSDDEKVAELNAGRAYYISQFKDDNIVIFLSITHTEKHGNRVVVYYIDKDKVLPVMERILKGHHNYDSLSEDD